MAPSLLPDERLIFFGSNRNADAGSYFQIYEAERDALGAPFGAIRLVPGLSDGQWHDTHPRISANSLEIVFASSRLDGAYRVHVARRSDPNGPFGKPEPLFPFRGDAGLADPNDPDSGPRSVAEICPWRDAKGDIWFSSQRETTPYRTFIARRKEGGYAEPVMVPELASSDTHPDICPVLSPDGLTLLIATLRGAPEGQWDVAIATRPNADGPFGRLENMRTINSADHDIPGWISNDGCRIYFSSSRGDGVNLQLFVATATL